MIGDVCLTLQELRDLTGSHLPRNQAAFLDNVGVAYLTRPDGSLGVLRKSVEQRHAHLRRLWRQYWRLKDKLDERYERKLGAWEHLPWPMERDVPEPEPHQPFPFRQNSTT